MRPILKTYLQIIFATYVLTACSTKEVPIKQPNILFIMTDDHSYQTISSYDDRLIQTPNLDRIANEGVIFNNSFVGNSICSPSRATMPDRQTGANKRNRIFSLSASELFI